MSAYCTGAGRDAIRLTPDQIARPSNLTPASGNRPAQADMAAIDL